MDKLSFIKGVLSTNAEIISPLQGGMMNESSIITDGEKKYVLYISTTQANEMVDRVLERENQALVFSLGITSKNVYFDTDKGIKINEYIEGSSLDKTDGYDIKKVANLLHILHNSPILCKVDYDPFARLEGYENELRIFCPERDQMYLEVRNELFKHKLFLENQKKVLCHNDAQKSNIIKSVNDEYFLIDFEFMGNNDPIYDIATFGNAEVREGFELLKEYAPNPSKDLMKRYYLWRMYISLQWNTVALIKHYRGEGKIHHFNFLDVGAHFLANAYIAYQEFKKL